MANFIVVIDQNPDRRSQYIKTIQPLLPPVDGLITKFCTQGDFYAIWAANSNAPISCSVDQEGSAIIWGDAIKQNESTRVDAREIKKLWKAILGQGLPCFDGFHAIVAYHPDFGLTVSADILGIFPVYYYIYNQVILVGSSQELFRYHPLFKPKFNPAGLVGILLTNGLFNGETLWQGVRRLEAGHSLIWQLGTAPREVKQYEISETSQDNFYANFTFSEHLDLLDELIEKTLKRHVLLEERYSLLLSGGLDSRMLAGFLHRQGVDIIALTLGRRTDLEMECAIPIAQNLGLQQHVTDIQLNQFPVYADLLVKWEHLANGFNGIVMGCGIHSQLQNLAPKFIAGFSIDVAVGGPLPVTRLSEKLSFDLFFTRGVNNWGFSPKLLERLLRKEIFGSLIQETLTQIQTVYERYSDIESNRSWWFELYHRQRFHVGGSSWKLCFGAWPTLSILDWQLLKTTSILPEETMGQRRAQKELLCTRFPQLAKLPLDHNDYNIEPLLPTLMRQRLARLFGLQRKWRRLQQRLGYERRYYYRILDLNNPGWLAVRRQAEPYREQVQHLFNPDVFNEILPTPDIAVQYSRDPITQASGVKALLGFLLWSRNNL